MAACLGMCGIVLDVTVRFNPDTSATKVTQTKMQYQDLFPPRGVPITEHYNPLKTFIEGHAGGAINYSPYNSALLHSAKLDVHKVDEYHKNDGVWTHAVDTLPGTPVCPVRTGLPIWGTQHEPFYDKDLFVPVRFWGNGERGGGREGGREGLFVWCVQLLLLGRRGGRGIFLFSSHSHFSLTFLPLLLVHSLVLQEDWMMNVPGSRVHRSFMGDWRLNTKWANYSPFMGQVVNNQVRTYCSASPPSPPPFLLPFSLLIF